jgi:hypothetical protein
MWANTFDVNKREIFKALSAITQNVSITSFCLATKFICKIRSTQLKMNIENKEARLKIIAFRCDMAGRFVVVVSVVCIYNDFYDDYFYIL